MGDVKRVFVSYAARDSELAEKLVKELDAHGLSTTAPGLGTSWTDKNLAAGAEWQREIEKTVKSADAVIIIVDAKGEPDRNQQFEWRTALESEWENPDKRLIPVLLQNAELPSFLSKKLGLRVKNPRREWDRAVEELIRLLKDEEPESREFLSVEEEDPAKRRERLQYIEQAAQALKTQEP
jgi:hypothetical protein